MNTFLSQQADNAPSLIETLITFARDNLTALLITCGICLAVCAVIYICFFKKINALIKKHREIIVYVIVGGLVTVFNFAVHFSLTHFFPEMNELLVVFIAWLFAVVVAYIANKLWVFESKSFKRSVLLHEIVTFTGARVFSLGVEELIFLIFVTWLNMSQLIIKIVAAIIVVIMNYIFSKFIIFKKK